MTPPTSKSGFILSIVITSGFIFQPLQVHHAAVLGAAGVQLIVGADGLNLAIIQEDDLVQPLHRGNAVGNQQGGLVGAAGFQVVQNNFFGAGVHSGNRVIQNQDGGVFQQGDARLLSRIIVNLTLPGALLSSFSAFRLVPSLLAVLAAAAAANVLLLAVSALVTRRRPGPVRALYLLNAPSYNIGTFVLPFVQSFLPPDMLLAVSIFVGIEFFLLKRGALKVFETKQNIIDLIIYTLTIIGTQLTFFVCIQYANAPFAAVLTATVPLWIMLFMFVFQHKHLTVKEIFCGIVAVAGVVLVVTGGSFKNFNVSGIGFWAGIGSGITFQLLLKGCTIEAPKPTD